MPRLLRCALTSVLSLQGCICPASSQCLGTQYNEFHGPFLGCREGVFELTPGACNGYNTSGWNPLAHPDCQYPRTFFTFNCTDCRCSPPGTPYNISSAASVNFKFGDINGQSALQAALNNIAFPNGGTMLSVGLSAVASQVFSVANGMRPLTANIPRVLVVLTDGKSQYQFEPKNMSTTLKSANITIFSIGVGSIYYPELQDMASLPLQSHIFEVSGFNSLTTIVDQLSQGVCNTPAIIPPGENSTDTLPPNNSTYATAKCSANVPIQIAQLSQTAGNAFLFVSTSNPNPSAVNSDKSDVSNSSVKLLSLNISSASAPLPFYIGVTSDPSSSVSAQYTLSISQQVFVLPTVTFSVSQNLSVGSAITTAPVMVGAMGYNPRYVYTFAGTVPSAFSLNSANGVITVASSLTTLGLTSIKLQLVATDSAVNCLTGYQTVVINIVDLTDHVPVINPKIYKVNYTEIVSPDRRRAATFPFLLTTILATDQDTGPNAVITFIMTVGNTSLFSVNATSGQVFALSNLKYEFGSSYNLTIAAQSGGGAITDTANSATVAISVINVPDPVDFDVPVDSNGVVDSNVPEGADAGTVVTQLDVNNPDNVPFTCSVQNDTNNNFQAVVVGNSCQVLTNGPINVPEDTTITINVVVNDANNHTSIVPVSVFVANGNTHPPAFNPASYFVSVAYNEPISSSVAKLGVSDVDNDIVTCSITAGNDLGLYVINEIGFCTISVAKTLASVPISSLPAQLAVSATDGAHTGVNSYCFVDADRFSRF